jgi:hypothetical protein
MDALIIYPASKDRPDDEIYPEHVINGVKESLKQAEEGKLILYTGIRDMLNIAS